jgi:Flp pilus assembly protein TadG
VLHFSPKMSRRRRAEKPSAFARSLRRDDDGSALVFAGVFLPVLAAVGMFAIDLSHIYLTHDRMKVATDAAAVGAALILTDPDSATHRAITLAAANVDPAWGTVTTEDDVEYGTYDPDKKSFTAGNTNVNAVRVTALRSTERGNAMPTYFAAVLGTPTVQIAASSIAVQVASTCVVVLNPSANAALSVAGTQAVNAPNCNVQVNSDSATALTLVGGSLNAKSICITGEAAGTSGATPKPTANCKDLTDPLANLPEPPPFAQGQNSPLVTNSMNSDYTYSGTITLSGTVSLHPGTYYFQNANVTIASGAQVSGNEVLLFLDKSSTLTMQEGSSLSITPPESGPYTGLSLFQSRSAPSTQASSLTGGGGTTSLGAIYMPTAQLSVSGNAQTGKIIVGTFAATGTGTLTIATPANRYAITPQRPTNQRTSLVY